MPSSLVLVVQVSGPQNSSSETTSAPAVPRLIVKTDCKAGRIASNHNPVVPRLIVKTGCKAGRIATNHNAIRL